MFWLKQSTRAAGPSGRLASRRILFRTFAEQNSAPKSPRSNPLFKRRFVPGLILGATAGFAFGIYFNWTKKHRKIGLDAPPASEYTVNLQPPTDTAPFPATISINRELFQALGTGVRTVTFLNFHVYAAGLYIAGDDVSLARKTLASLQSTFNPSNDTAEWEKRLLDPQAGTEIVNALLKANVRFAVRIVPVRNTDFNHLRDGFVRGITNYPEFKSLQSPEVGQSINEIKRAFGRKRKLKKGEVITWSRDLSGGMTAWYGDSDEEKELLGAPPNADVSRLFFLQYMTGSKPNSPTLRVSAAHGLAGLLA